MYGGPHSVKRNILTLQFLVDNYRETFCFGRFQRQLSHSIALRPFPNDVCPLTCGCTFIADFTMSVAGLKPMKPLVIRMLIRTLSVCGESSILRSDQRMFISAPRLHGRKRGDMSMFRQLQNFGVLQITTIVLVCFGNAFSQISYKVTDLGALGDDNLACAMSINNEGWVGIQDASMVPGQQDNAGGKILKARDAIEINGSQFDLGTLGGQNSWMNWGEINDFGQIVGYSETAALAVRGRSVFVVLLPRNDSSLCEHHEHAFERFLLRDPCQNRSPEA